MVLEYCLLFALRTGGRSSCGYIGKANSVNNKRFNLFHIIKEIMDTIECIKTRSSIRNYKSNPVPESIFQDILNAGVHAPSAGDVQDWEFVVVRKPGIKKQIAEAALGQDFVANAPVVIVVCSNLEKIERVYGERGVGLYSIQDTAAATENMLLAAWERGIGSCWVGAFNEERIKEILLIPTNVRPLAIVTMGYPQISFKKQKNRDLSMILHWERWNGK